MSRFISNSSFVRQRMRFFTPVVTGTQYNISYYANNENKKYMHKKNKLELEKKVITKRGEINW